MQRPVATDLEILPASGPRAGADGFRLVGRALDGGRGLCRVWLRRLEPWERAIDPRASSRQWDLRVSLRLDSAFALQADFGVSQLAGLAETFAFVQRPPGLAGLRPNGDPVHDAVLAWAREATGTTDEEPASAAPPEAAAPAAQTDDSAEAAPGEPAADAAPLSDDGWDETAEIVARATGSVPAVPAAAEEA